MKTKHTILATILLAAFAAAPLTYSTAATAAKDNATSPAATKAPAGSPAPTAASMIVPGKESGSITVASFEKILKEAPDSIVLIDVRDPDVFAAGTFKGAINIPVNTLAKKIETLPTDKPIVFFCGDGGRSSEAVDMLKLVKPSIKAYFPNAIIQFKKDGSYTMVEKKVTRP
jgi:rhodanese-related sulfurtransferase